MSTGTNLLGCLPLNHGGATPAPSRPTSSHGPMDETLQKVIQEHVKKLSDDDKTAFHSASDIIVRLQEMQGIGKPAISGSLMSRVEKVLQCVKGFMGSLGIFIQQSPEISSLVVGAVNCILTVGANRKSLLYVNLG